MNNENVPLRKTFRRLFVIPFGRFRRHVAASESESAVFVGRQGARAYLIDALTSNARRGAYLVTGRRGVGKSTFVELCIKEAEQLKFRRYMRRRAGRSLLDQLLVLLCILTLLVIVTIDLEISNSIIREEISSPIIPLLILIPTLLIIGYAGHSFRIGFLSLGVFNRFYTLVSCLVLCFAVIALSYKFPWQTLYLILAMLCVLSFAGTSIGHAIAKHRYVLGTLKKRLCVTAATLLLLALTSLTLIYSIEFFLNTEIRIFNAQHFKIDTTTKSVILLVVASAVLYSLVRLYAYTFCNVTDKVISSAFDVTILLFCYTYLTLFFTDPRIEPIVTGSNWFQTTATYIATSAVWIAPIAFLFIARQHPNNQLGKERNTPINDTTVNSDKNDTKDPIFIARPVELLFLLKGCCFLVLSAPVYLGLFNHYILKPPERNILISVEQHALWTGMIAMCVLFIFLLEYLWITRAFARLRYSNQSQVYRGSHVVYTHHHDYAWTTLNSNIEASPTKFGLGGEPVINIPDSVRLFRLMDRATLSSALVRFWTPSLVVRINLGFDSLDHRSVIHAMLHGLRDSYRQRFLHGFSAYTTLEKLFRTFIILFIASWLSMTLFSYPPINFNDNLDSNTNYNPLSKLSTSNATIKPCDYASLNRLPPSNAGSADTVLVSLCTVAPELMNQIFPILYTPLIRIAQDSALQQSHAMKAAMKDTMSDPSALEPDRTTAEIESHVASVDTAAPGSSGNDTADDETDLPLSCKLRHVTEYDTLDMLLNYHCSLPLLDHNGSVYQYASFNLRVHHLLVLVLVYWLTKPIFAAYSPLPYRRNLLKIESLAYSLTNSKTTSTQNGAWSMGRIMSSLTSMEKHTEQARSALDSRSVELSFMTLLTDICKPQLLDTPRMAMINVPAPDIVFVFDELDKIGNEEATPVTENDDTTDRKRRSDNLHELLSDMKRLISSAPARFIFVGNRSLHDEFMADEGKREPLLTTIFDADLYLPSLLIDASKLDGLRVKESRGRSSQMENLISEYLRLTYTQALDYRKQQSVHWNSLFHLISGSKSLESKYNSGVSENIDKLTVMEWNFATNSEMLEDQKSDDRYSNVLAIHKEITASFISDYIGFLAFRSKGIPKKLGDIIASQVRPTQRLLDKKIEQDRIDDLVKGLDNSEDALLFDHSDMYRVQLINTLYRQVVSSFEIQLIQRDDKVTIDVLYLFDFLIKFHARAFSWSNLEHIDELAHIHKTPDLRKTIADVLDAGIGRYYHPVLNGLYSFKFRSEFAAEIRYLSKLNEAEMAAFNFTLDESQTLKAAYTKIINSTDTPNEDIMVALGELHEYDQEFEKARGWYYRALFLNDQEFARYVGDDLSINDQFQIEQIRKITSNPFGNDSSVELVAEVSTTPERVPYLSAIVSGDTLAGHALKVHLPWATRRIRLLLQLGLTYEQTNDLERAKSYYFTAHKLTRAISLQLSHRLKNQEQSELDSINWFSLACDNLELLYQPAFAAAWVAEKSYVGVDCSIDIVERELQELNNRLQPRVPYRSEITQQEIQHNEATAIDRQALFERSSRHTQTFSMIGAEAYNKAGDLYFFKGRYEVTNPEQKSMKYLSKACRHYSCALSIIQSYLSARPFATYDKLCTVNRLPSFVSQAIYNNITDLAETTFACISIQKLIAEVYFLDKFNGNAATPSVQEASDPDADIGASTNDTFNTSGTDNTDDTTNELHSYQFVSATNCGGVPFSTLIEDAYTVILDYTSGNFSPLRKLNSSLWFADALPISGSSTGPGSAAEQSGKAMMSTASMDILRRIKLIESLCIDDQWRLRTETVQPGVDIEANVGAEEEAKSYCFRLEEELYSGSSTTVARAILLSALSGLYAERSGLKRAAIDEYVMTLEMIERVTKWIRISRFNMPARFFISNTVIEARITDLFEYLSDTSLFCLRRIGELYNRTSVENDKLEQPDLSSGGPDERTLADAASQGCGILLSISWLFREKELYESHINYKECDVAVRFNKLQESIQALMAQWFDIDRGYYMHPDNQPEKDKVKPDLILSNYDFAANETVTSGKQSPVSKIRSFARSRLIYLNDRYTFPVLTSLQRLKLLADDVYLIEGMETADIDSSKKWLSEADRWSSDFFIGAERFDSHHLLTYLELSETSYLQERSHNKGSTGVKSDHNYGKTSNRFARLADQTCSMGNEYYRKIRGMTYLFDDFNDRKTHFKHAVQMAGYDTTQEILNNNLSQDAIHENTRNNIHRTVAEQSSSPISTTL